MVLQICFVANARTQCSRALAVKGKLMLSWVTLCVCTTSVRSLGVVTRDLLPPVGPIMVFLLTRRMELLRGSVERLLGKLFGHPFLKFYSWRQTLVMLEFEIIETILLGGWGSDGPREDYIQKECYEACGSINIKCTDSCIERVLVDTHVWRFTTNGQYSAKTAYEAMFVGVTKFSPWERIWKTWAPLKCRFFMWLVALTGYWTADRLARHGIPSLESYPFCDQVEESINHLLVACIFSRQFWFIC
jgi:hypothetical protein